MSAKARWMYVPTAQVNDGVVALNNRIGAVQWVVRTRLQPFSLGADIQRELREAAGGLPVAHIRSTQQVVGESTARNDFNMTPLAGVALLLTAIGVYGLMAYSVQ
jgi:putative ABC transport system permease protein